MNSPALKSNQGTLSKDIEIFFSEQQASKYKGYCRQPPSNAREGSWSYETRSYTSIGAIEWLKRRHDWAGLKSIVMAQSTPEINGGKTEQETLFYIPSRKAAARTRDTLWDAIAEALSEFTIKDCGKFFKNSGYVHSG